MKMDAFLLLSAIIALSFSAIAFGFELPLQDFCVADLNSPVKVNGQVCKNPASVTPNDFFLSGLDKVGNTSNPYGLGVTPASISQIPGLNTLGISLTRIDLAPTGIVPPHTHPRATEVLLVLEGTIKAGFVTSSANTHFYKVLKKGDVFVVPVGLVHYLYNIVPKGNAVVLAALNSENPGTILLANSLFGATPDLDVDFLAKTFLTSKSVINGLLKKF